MKLKWNRLGVETQFERMSFQLLFLSLRKHLEVLWLFWDGLARSQISFPNILNIFVDLGRITASYTAPFHSIWNPKRVMERRGRKLLDQLVSIHATASAGLSSPLPVFFHTMSGNGAFEYAFLLEQLRKHSNNNDDDYQRFAASICGSSFDSGPVSLDLSCMVHGFAAAVSPKHGRSPHDSRVLLFLLRIFFRFCFLFPFFPNTRSHALALMVQLPIAVPQIYLYSHADPVAPSSFIEAFARAQAERWQLSGRKVESQRSDVSSPFRSPVSASSTNSAVFLTSPPLPPIILQSFEDSGHVQHYRHHPQQYTSILLNFVTECEEIQRKRQLQQQHQQQQQSPASARTPVCDWFAL